MAASRVTFRLKPSIVVALGVACFLLALLGAEIFRRLGKDVVAMSYTVTLAAPETGRVRVRAEISEIRSPVVSISQFADDARIDNIRIHSEHGTNLWYRTRGRTFQIWTGLRNHIVVEYDVEPGAFGRHGHQGYVSKEFALLPSRLLFFAPKRDTQWGAFRVRFEAPEGWNVVHSWEDVGDGWLDPRIHGELLQDSIGHSSIGMGPFEIARRDIHGSQLEVAIWRGFPDEFRQVVIGRSTRIFELLQQRLQFRLDHRFVPIFVPDAPDSRGIIASYWTNGLGNHMDNSARAWRLYAHRLTHVVNRDRPYGMHLGVDAAYPAPGVPRSWVTEGMATFFEDWATREAQISSSVFEGPWEIYAREHTASSKLDVPLIDEAVTRDPATIEYLHYQKAAVFMSNLNREIIRRSRGAKDFAEFVSILYARYGNHKKAMPFFEELRAYAGEEVMPFVASHVEDDETLLPFIYEVLPPSHRAPGDLVAWVDGDLILADARFLREGSGVPRLVREAIMLRMLDEIQDDTIDPDLIRALPWIRERDHDLVIRRVREILCKRLLGERSKAGEMRLDEYLESRLVEATVWTDEEVAASSLN